MPSPALARGVYAITDCSRLNFDQVLNRTAAILGAGIVALQYRNKDTDDSVRRRQAEELAALCRHHGTPLIINDEPDLAAHSGADGVHLGRDDVDCRAARQQLGPGALIGVSCYDSLERALDAQTQGADYVAFGAFFPTSTKRATAHPRPELLTRARAQLQVPIVAIGGIRPDNAQVLVDAGAMCVAVISALYESADPAAVMRKFQTVFRQPDKEPEKRT